MRRQTMIAALSVFAAGSFSASQAPAQNSLLDAKIPREAESSSSGLVRSVSPIANAKRAKAIQQETSQESAAPPPPTTYAPSSVAPSAAVPKLRLAPARK
jgi:hypothetical protein